MITVYGVPGWGSTISELMLSLADIPYEVVDVEGFDQPGPARERLRQINPLCQVPTLRLADGSIMTETAAIALMILDQRPDLAPAPGTPQRPQFQRLLVWLVENCRQHRKNLYLWFEQQLAAGPWALGASVTLLDCYIAAMYRWGPRQAWFDDHAPKFAAIARAVCQRPELAAALRRNKLI
ncbi:TPA: glutathione S-transferase family protein [Klebsiella pneumoniae]|uniref:glutathione S-transferase family protein n=1 Tax=Klebsiella TaxID=570 RepID=UPI00058CABC7|nr:glutathione S-transferase [Klebsiella pneumoniae]EKZ5573233.1 glutathione S-transferase [Klebsiella pneumoniae]MBA8001200.1 glutathione S-transferase [Klebsiella pneumoniae]SWY71738.1 glutathione S-transferase, theta [Klebsiella pneumoniae]SXJ26425.1 glutathione S-transferase, theta [Klebsiella pneumoniae]HBS6610607.1 glutathione S-transferase [Klebsiella pneumoniae]